jgi:4-hydroxybenzoyl-CoA thioesterase
VNVVCDFIKPSKIGEIITLTLKIERIGNSSLKLNVSALYKDEVRSAAHLTVCVNSLETGRAVPIPDDLRARLEDFSRGKLDVPRPKELLHE